MRSAHLTADFADGEYTFRLAWGGLIELQENCNAGPHALLNRIQANEWLVQDISETIRIGLIGGDEKMQPVKAKKLVDRYVKERPLSENIALARLILMVALFGGETIEPLEQEKKASDVNESLGDPDGKLKIQDIYGIGAVIGYTPKEVNEMSMWQFMTAYKGYLKANTVDDNEGSISEKEASDLWEFVQNTE